MFGFEFAMLAKAVRDLVKEHFSKPAIEPLSKEDQVALRNALEGRYCDRCQKNPAVYNIDNGEWLCKDCASQGTWWIEPRMKMKQ